MAHTSMAAAGSALLAHGDARYKEGPFSYRIHVEDGHAYYSVSGPTDTLSSLLLWAFGSGSVGQSYLFEHDGALYEARISFLDGRGFELTPGDPPDIPESVKFAVGRPIPSDEQVKCFGCHTVASRAGDRFDPAQAMLGISCEGCHGPGAAHVAMAKSGVTTPGLIFNPARLTPLSCSIFVERVTARTGMMPSLMTFMPSVFRL
jgi:Cytochrome c554 and c-prime